MSHITIKALSVIIATNDFTKELVVGQSPADMRNALATLLQDADKCNDLWRRLSNFHGAVCQLEDTQLALGKR